MDNIIVITSGKGGTGKSTVTASLGVALAKKGHSTLLIDCDWGLKCLDLLLGVTENSVYNLEDILKGNCEPIRAIYHVPDVDNLSIIPAPESIGVTSSCEDFKRLCEGLTSYYDYILIDCPAGIDESFKFAICPADLALVVVNPDPVSVRDGERVGNLLDNYGIHNHRLVINKFHRSILKFDVTSNLDKIIDGTSLQLIGVVPEDKQIQAAALNCVPLMEKTPAAKAFARIASRIDGENVSIPKKL